MKTLAILLGTSTYMYSMSQKKWLLLTSKWSKLTERGPSRGRGEGSETQCALAHTVVPTQANATTLRPTPRLVSGAGKYS